MAYERVFFQRGRQRQILRLSKAASQLTWEKYCTRIGVSSYNVLKAIYLNERNSLPLRVLNQVVGFLRDEEWLSWIFDFRTENWGQAKGGSISLKAWHMRMKKNLRKYREIQSSRFRLSGNYKYVTSAGYEVRSSYELVLAENLIANKFLHYYEPMIRCRNHILFPDFQIRSGSRNALIEICGFRFEQNWKRLSRKLRIYLSNNVNAVLVVVYPKQNERLAMPVIRRFHKSVLFATIEDMSGLLRMLMRFKNEPGPVQVVTQVEALKRSQQTNGKAIHWQHLLATTPREAWIETLTTCGLPEIKIKRIRQVAPIEARLVKATQLALNSGRVPREALVEMIAGTCNGSAGDHFGSMNNLLAIAYSGLERFR